MAKEMATCKTCGKEFSFYRSTLRGKDGQFCSRKCVRIKPNSGQFKDQGALRTGICKTCGKSFVYYRSRISKYCGRNCVSLAGESNPAWKGGTTSLNKRERRRFNVGKTSREILKRDNYNCQICGERGKKLQIDHIQPWSENIELRFSMDNCRTVCIPCHYFITFGKPMPKDSRWGNNYYKKWAIQ